MPPSYFVYTTGNGFPPIIESVPHALKGIGTAFMIALLTGKYMYINHSQATFSHGDPTKQ